MGWVCIARLSPTFIFAGIFGVLNCIIYIFIAIVFTCFLSYTPFTSVTSCFLPLFLFLRWCIRRVLYFSQLPFLCSGICEGKFWHWYCETSLFFVENQRVSSFLPWQAEFDLKNFFTVIGVKFVDITFSIMKGDKLVIEALLDSMIINLRKGTSVSLSEESDSFKLCLNFLFEKEAISVIYFSLVLCSTTHQRVKLEKGMNQGGNPFDLAETEIQYQYTRIKSKISNLWQILIFITQSNRVKKSFPLNIIDPQPPPSSTYKIKGWPLFRKTR